MPDDSIVSSFVRGRVQLIDHLSLEHVIYVPSLTCNLISITRLMDDYHCDISFSHSLCIIQDRSTRIAIGAGERRGGLFYWCDVPISSQLQISACREADCGICHSRLGHPSNHVLQSLPFIRSGSSGSSLNKACDVCH